jgi:predicted GIY-YIG superfamily endonuclease
MTGRTAEERFDQHKCGYKANRYVRQFGIRLYANYQGIATHAEALAAEERLARRLRKRGYAVWWG